MIFLVCFYLIWSLLYREHLAVNDVVKNSYLQFLEEHDYFSIHHQVDELMLQVLRLHHEQNKDYCHQGKTGNFDLELI